MQRPRVCYSLVFDGSRPQLLRTVRRGGKLHRAVVEGGQGPDAAELRQGYTRSAAALPGSRSLWRRITLPYGETGKARRVLPAALDLELPFALESALYAVPVMISSGGESRALVVAARRGDVESFLEQCRGAGLDPEHLDEEGLVCWQGSRREKPGDGGRVVARIGRRDLLLVFGRGGGCERALVTDAGIEPLRDEKRADLSCERLRRRLRPLLADIAADGEPLWCWAGSGALEEDVLQRLQRSVADILTCRFEVHDDPATFVARSLAGRALMPSGLRCELRGASLPHPVHIRRVARRRGLALGGAALTGLLLCLLNGVWAGALAARRGLLEERIAGLARELAGSGVPRGQEVLLAGRAMEEHAPLLRPFQRAASSPATSLLAELLEISAAGGLLLSEIVLEPQRVRIAGSADRWEACEKLAAVLTDAGYRLEPLRRSGSPATERVSFVLEGERNGR